MTTLPPTDSHRDQSPSPSPIPQISSPTSTATPEQQKTPSIQLLPPSEPSSSNAQSHKVVSGPEPTSSSSVTTSSKPSVSSPSSSLHQHHISGSASLSVSRNSRRSLASIAFEKTSSAFANFTSIGSSSSSQSNHSLRSASSSGSLPRNSLAAISYTPAPTSVPVATAEEVKSNGAGAIGELTISDSSSEDTITAAVSDTSSQWDTPQQTTQKHHHHPHPHHHHHQTTVSQPLPSPTSTDEPSSNSPPQSNRRHTIQGNPLALNKRVPSPVPEAQPLGGQQSRMHQTSSRLLRMTNEDRPFTKVWLRILGH
jgi:hypothetical protein